MNCPNCGAGLTISSLSSLAMCDYCGTTHQRQTAARGVDRIDITDQPLEQKCPACRTHLFRGFVDEYEVAACQGCEGFLVAGGAIRRIIEGRRATFEGVESVPQPLDDAFLNVPGRACPQCHEGMERHPYYGPGNAIIEDCGRCCRLWFEAGTLAAIEAAPGSRKKQAPIPSAVNFEPTRPLNGTGEEIVAIADVAGTMLGLLG